LSGLRRSLAGSTRARCGPAAATGALLLAAAAGQEGRWQLAPTDLARYRRTVTTTVERADGGAPARSLEFVGPDNPALLFGTEFDRTRRAPAAPANDLRELARFVAFDLWHVGRRGRRVLTAPAVVPYGDVVLRVQQDDAGADGRQRIRCELAARPPEPPAQDRTLFLTRLSPRCKGSLAGTLEVTRIFDRERGVVTQFSAELAATVAADDLPDAPRLAVVRREAWELVDVQHGRPRDFEQRVAQAITRARDWLLHQVAAPDAGDLAPRVERDTETRTAGRLALVLLALVHAEAETDQLREGYAALRRRDIRDTYSLAAAILALEALHAPRQERRAILEGLQAGPRPRQLPPEDLALVQGYCERLLANADPRVAADRELRFSYTRRDDYDNSNTHFAVLGLHAAALCGATVPPTAFAACAHHYLADQDPADKTTAPLRLTRYGRDGDPDDKATVAGSAVRAAGWPYRRGEEATASMTAAAVASLLLCRSHVERSRRSELDAAITAGFAWLARRWTMLGNASTLRVEREWRTYHLYALERACEYDRVALLDGIDWYHEGAAWLLEAQAADGHFPGFGYEDTTAATCFGLLFLKKAALPVHTK